MIQKEITPASCSPAVTAAHPASPQRTQVGKETTINRGGDVPTPQNRHGLPTPQRERKKKRCFAWLQNDSQLQKSFLGVPLLFSSRGWARLCSGRGALRRKNFFSLSHLFNSSREWFFLGHSLPLHFRAGKEAPSPCRSREVSPPFPQPPEGAQPGQPPPAPGMAPARPLTGGASPGRGSRDPAADEGGSGT